MAVVTVAIKVVDDAGSIEDWTGTYDLDTSRGNLMGLLKRIRILVRREFIRRSLMVGTEDDKTK